MSNNKDFKVKNGIQPTVYHEGLGTVVSGSVGYNISGITYSGNSLSVSAQDGVGYGISLKTDGTKMFVLGDDNNSVFAYTLTTAWDLSTASYDSVSFSVGSQATNPHGIFFRSDGLKMYVVCGFTDAVYEYTLSTAWDISTATYSSNSFSISSQAVDPVAVSLKEDGTKMFILDTDTDAVYEYTLSTAWDVSTSSYSSNSFSVSSQDTTPQGLLFKPDGSYMYMLGEGGRGAYEYSLSTPWDITSASYTGNFSSFSSQETFPTDFYLSPDGTKMYVVGIDTDAVYQYSTVLTTASLDLSTGSVFDYTPTSDVQVTLSNPADSGTVSGATLLLGSEDSTGVGSTFSTTLYTGNGSTQTITNGLDLSTDGGLVWIKVRDYALSHYLFDTERGISTQLKSNSTDFQSTISGKFVTSFNTDGFTVDDDVDGSYGVNGSSGTYGNDYVSWAFKKQSSFFDVVTYTGDGVAGKTVSHSLGSDVGTLIVKKTNSADNWFVWHRGLTDATYRIMLNSDSAEVQQTNAWNSTAPSSTEFTLGDNGNTNASGDTYVAYLFAHDTDASSLIKCGSYTGTGSAGKAVTLGWEPQWLMIKRTDATGYSWEIMDTQRGFTSGNDKVLRANSSGAEITAYDYGTGTSTGFELTNDIAVNASGGSYIYIAIRAESIPTITYDPTLEWPGGTAPTAPANGETDVVTFNTRDGGSTYQGVLAIDGAK